MINKLNTFYWYTVPKPIEPGDKVFYNVSIYTNSGRITSLDLSDSNLFHSRRKALLEYSNLIFNRPGAELINLNLIVLKESEKFEIQLASNANYDHPVKKAFYGDTGMEPISNYWMKALDLEFKYYTAAKIPYDGNALKFSNCFTDEAELLSYGEIISLPGCAHLYNWQGLKIEVLDMEFKA